MNKILLTGSSGFVGKNILKSGILSDFKLLTPTSDELNLLDIQLVKSYLNDSKPDLIIHSAGKVGGILKNIKSNYNFLLDNSLMAINLISESLNSGVSNFLNISSSCIYPKDFNTPIKESDLLKGKLEPTNEGYALAKIIALKMSEFIYQDHGLNYKTIIPCNLYGPFDNFNLETAHMIPAVINKINIAKKNNENSVKIWGDGKSLREFMFIEDLINFILFSIKNIDDLPNIINVGTGKDYRIEEYYIKIANEIGYNGKFEYDLSKPTGMQRKLVDTSILKSIGWESAFTIEEGISKTFKYFKTLNENKV
jgi:GDP-L-fucose synthase